ncbi:putative receptor protein kinase ZmPK1 [Hordeum vulgare]|nr:putative receptor protein kinase ZmPK1 [Hordeum vulgare]
MGGRADIPFTPPYVRDPAVAADANPSTGSSRFAFVGAPPTTGLARGLFTAPWTTLAAGGVAPTPAVKPRAPFSKLPNTAVAKKGKTALAAGGVAPTPVVKLRAPFSKLPNTTVAKKGKVSEKKNKAADSSSRRPKKRLAGRAKDAAAIEVPASSLAASAADAHKVVDEMPPSFNDETYMSTMGVGSNNSHWSQTNDVHFDDHEFEVDEDGEGIVGAPKGRAGNYSMDEDVLLCNTWLQVSRDATVGGDQSRDAY